MRISRRHPSTGRHQARAFIIAALMVIGVPALAQTPAPQPPLPPRESILDQIETPQEKAAQERRMAEWRAQQDADLRRAHEAWRRAEENRVKVTCDNLAGGAQAAALIDAANSEAKNAETALQGEILKRAMLTEAGFAATERRMLEIDRAGARLQNRQISREQYEAQIEAAYRRWQEVLEREAAGVRAAVDQTIPTAPVPTGLPYCPLPPKRLPTQTSQLRPLSLPGNALQNCSFGQAGCSFPASFTPAQVPVSADSQTLCTFGPAVPTMIALTPADATGKPNSPLEVLFNPAGGKFVGISPLNLITTAPPGTRYPAMSVTARHIEAIREAINRASAPPEPMNIDDKPRGQPQVQTGNEKANQLNGTTGPDVMTGKEGNDEFWFKTSRDPKRDDPTSTLTEGDRITDYESKESIFVEGVNLKPGNVRVTYDPQKDETTLEIDLDDPQTGQKDGVADRKIILTGNKTGTVSIGETCCAGGLSDIKIDMSTSDHQPTPQQATPRESTPQQSTPQQATPQQSTPQDIATPNSETVVHITIYFKVTEAALQGGSGVDLPAENMKLVAQQVPDLPKTKMDPLAKTLKAALDKGFNKSPVACTTAKDGGCKAQIPMEDREIYGLPANGAKDYVAALALKKNTGAVIEKGPAQLTPEQYAALNDVPAAAQVTQLDFKVGNKTYTRVAVAAPDALAADLVAKLTKAFGVRVQIDFCEEKKPGPPLGMEPVSYSALNSELPQQTIRVGRIAR